MAQRLDGILVLNKPGGITSRLAIDKAWWWLPRGTRIGHAGTLDPMATGVLLVCVGRATRLIEHLHNQPKTYRADILFGASSTTDDAARDGARGVGRDDDAGRNRRDEARGGQGVAG